MLVNIIKDAVFKFSSWIIPATCTLCTSRFGLGKVHQELLSQPPPQVEPREAEPAPPGEGENATVSPEVGDITGFNKIDFTEWKYR